MKLKVKVGDGEIQRRTYGEQRFELVIKELAKKNQHSVIGHQEIKERIDSLDKVIPSKQQVEQKRLARIAEIKSRLEAIDKML